MKTYNGNVEITKDNHSKWKKTLKGVTEITGDLYIHSNASLPKLETVGGDLYIYSNASLPKLETVGGNLYIHSNASLTAEKLETVGGYLYIYSNASLTAEKLETVGWNLYIYSNASLPKLETVGGYLHIYSNASLPKLETVGCNLYIHSNASLTAGKLIKGNPLDARGRVFKSFAKRGYLLSDNILSRIVSKKKAGEIVVWKTTRIGDSSKIVYVVQRGETYSHGETVKQAIHDLRYKLSDRDTTKYAKWTLKSVHPIADIIQAYRAITGACEEGTRQFCEARKVPAKMTVAEAIKVTHGAYQSRVFKAFFVKGDKL